MWQLHCIEPHRLKMTAQPLACRVQVLKMNPKEDLEAWAKSELRRHGEWCEHGFACE